MASVAEEPVVGPARGAVHLDLEMVRDIDALQKLAPAWDRLFWQKPDAFLTESFAAAQAAWSTVARPRGRGLRTVVGRMGGEVVLIWPLVLRRQGLWRVLRPLNAETAEYPDLLVDPSLDPSLWIAEIWQHVRACAGADAATFPYVRAGTDLDLLIDQVGSDYVEAWTSTSASWSDERTWERYYAGLNRDVRKKTNQKARRLGELGRLDYEIVSSGDRFTELFDWMIAEKVKWMTATGRQSPWLQSAEFRAYILELARTSPPPSTTTIFALMLDGRPVAGQLACIHGKTFEGFIGAFAADMDALSPGHVLRMHCLKWAADRGLRFDLRMGDEPYKRFYATEHTSLRIVTIALTPWGRAFTVAKGARAWMRVQRQKLKHAPAGEAR
jgi:CelD/BcsL family acetyltransferase involved in cellulose biosynthesis